MSRPTRGGGKDRRQLQQPVQELKQTAEQTPAGASVEGPTQASLADGEAQQGVPSLDGGSQESFGMDFASFVDAPLPMSDMATTAMELDRRGESQAQESGNAIGDDGGKATPTSPATLDGGAYAGSDSSLAACPPGAVVAPSVVRAPDGPTNEHAHVASIYFGTGKTEIDGPGFAVLWDIVETYRPLLREADRAEFTFQGSADYQGSEAFNDGLSSARAREVADFFRDQLGSFASYSQTVEGFGEESKPETCDPQSMGEARRVDITVFVTAQEPRPYDPEAEREAAKPKVESMLGRAIQHLEKQGGTQPERTARMLKQLQKPGMDDSYLDPGTARQYVLKEMAHTGIRPDDVASHAMRAVLNGIAGSGDDVAKFADRMVSLDDGIFLGIEAIGKLYANNGDTYRSARVLLNWAEERQNDPTHIYFAHRK